MHSLTCQWTNSSSNGILFQTKGDFALNLKIVCYVLMSRVREKKRSHSCWMICVVMNTCENGNNRYWSCFSIDRKNSLLNTKSYLNILLWLWKWKHIRIELYCYQFKFIEWRITSRRHSKIIWSRYVRWWNFDEWLGEETSIRLWNSTR